MTRSTREILVAFIGHPTQDQHSADICAETGLSSGTVYPVLARLEALHWVDGGWEQPTVHQQGWPRRRYYRLSPYGLAMARGALAGARAEPFWRLRPAAEPS